jgi:hypothetical protein
MGAQRDSAMALLREVMTEALTLDKDATERLLRETGVGDTEAALRREVIGHLPPVEVRGAVAVRGSMQVTQ